MASLLLERKLGERWSVQFAMGAALGGTFTQRDASYTVVPGPFVAVAAAYRFLDGRGAAPFLLGSFSLGAALTWTRELGVSGATDTSMESFDGRLGLTVGKTFGGIFSPYLAGRVFGLPVLWSYQGHSVTGNDAYHYQAAVGVSLRVGVADLLLEAVPLGEQGVTFGSGISF